MTQRATAISIRADRTYIKAVNAFAADEGFATADLVREALEKHCGDKLKPYISFFAKSGEKNSQSAKKTESSS